MLMPFALALATTLTVSTATSVAPIVVAPQQVPASLDWRIELSRADTPAGSVQFSLGYHEEHTSSWTGGERPLEMLDGLSAAQLAAAGQPVAFTIRRDAGDFQCKGVAGQGQGVGTCVFAAKGDFAAALAKRGVAGRLEAYPQFQLAMHDIGLAYVDELKREGYATPSTDDLLKAGTHGAGMNRLLAMDAAGYRFGDVAALVRVTDHGVNPRYIQALADYGYAKLPAEQLVRMRDHGVSATYIGEMKAHGYAGLAPEELVRLRDHGVAASFVAEMQAIGYDGLPTEALSRLRDHGVSAGFVRTANASGKHLTPDELIQMRDRGERPGRGGDRD